MFKRNYLLIILLPVLFASCKKTEDPDNRMNFLFSNEKAQRINDTTIRFNARIYANSSYNNASLLEPNFFSVNSTVRQTISDGKSLSVTYHMNEISRTLVTGQAKPLSLFVLVDKSVKSINDNFNQTALLGTETSLVSFYKDRAGYEINVGAFATNNANVPASFLTLSPVFKSDIAQLPIDSLGFVFDINKNSGTANLSVALDNSLDYISKNAHYANRAILLITDFNSAIADSTEIKRLANKAKSLGTSINILSTDLDNVPFGHLKLVSQSGGMNCPYLSTGELKNSFDLLVPALNDYLTSGNYYKCLIEVRTDKQLFNNADWAILTGRLGIYSNSNRQYQIQFLYEK